jgi:hypothetical protein
MFTHSPIVSHADKVVISLRKEAVPFNVLLSWGTRLQNMSQKRLRSSLLQTQGMPISAVSGAELALADEFRDGQKI